jgi:diacylglycerol kinase (ATP)
MAFWSIIVNPKAGNGAVERQWPAIERALQEQGFSYSVFFTRHKGHATEWVEKILRDGQRNLLAIGGDGTNNEVIHGIFQQKQAETSTVRYALLPVGTGNDWAKQYNIPKEVGARLERLRQENTVQQDIGRVDYVDMEGRPATRYFANVAGMAYDAYVAQCMERNGKPSSHLAYLLAVGRYLFSYRLSKASIAWDGNAPVEDRFYTINVGICKYSGGGMQLVPHALPADGLLALTFARSMPKLEVLLQTYRFYNGTLLQHRRISGVQAKQVTVAPSQGQPPLLLEADGELLGHAPATFTILEKALTIIL